MIGKTVLHYKILEKLGEGGMGVVYKAHDTKLDRFVAIKFVSQEDASSENSSQLLLEARAASRISHLNVCVVYSVEDYQNETFIVLEWIEGETLLQKIRRSGPLPIDEAVHYAVQTLLALEEAHRHGMIHRDVKSDNIMLKPNGEIKVMDFGLAKLKHLTEVDKSKITVGTMAYMSPEQIENKPVDARSDVFSLGIVLYELLSGRLPFRGDYESAMMYSILNEQPRPLQDIRPEIADELSAAVHKAIEKNPAKRFSSAADFKNALLALLDVSPRISRVRAQSKTLPNSKPPFGWNRGRLKISAIVLLVIATLTYVVFSGGGTTIDSVAVLPFVNSTNDPGLDYVSDGLTENLINNLTFISSLRVVPRSSVFYYKQSELDPITIGKRLKVRSIITGKISRRGNQLIIQADLVDLEEQAQLWGEQYNRPADDLIDLEENISKEIVRKLRLKITGEEQLQISTRATNDPLAYQYFLKGQYHWARRTTLDLTRAIEFFTKAVARDSVYAEAYAGLAKTYAILQEYTGFSSYDYPLKGEAYAQKAIDLDPTIAECHTVLGYLKQNYFWDYGGAESSFMRALAMNPKDPTAHHWYSLLLCSQGRFGEAVDQIRQAQRLDPLSLIIGTNVGVTYYLMGEYDNAIAELNKVIDLDPSLTYSRAMLVNCYLEKGDLNKAADLFSLLPGDYRNVYAGYYYARTNQREQALRSIDLLDKTLKAGYSVQFDLAMVYLGLNDFDHALEWLDKAADIRDGRMRTLKVWKIWDPVRTYSKFSMLLQRVGLKN